MHIYSFTVLWSHEHLMLLQTMAKLLLTLGAQPNGRCLGGYTAMHGACFSGSRRILAKMLAAGADLEVHDCWRQTPM